MRLGYDDNLGLPGSVGTTDGIEPVSFHDIAALVQAFSSGDVGAIFAPAGALPSLAGIAYEVLSQARVRGRTSMESRLVVRTDDSCASAAEAAGLTMGCINEFCTTSYWAPMITLLDATPVGTALHLRRVTGFDDLLAKVADGTNEVAMVWDQVLDRHPDEAAEMHVLATRQDLPAPLVFGRADLPETDRTLVAGAFAGAVVDDPAAFFDGFGAPDDVAIDAFAGRLASVQAHFDLVPFD
jgi:ABC-type phosphate/phosphonate transport system substrate-binding protein